MKKLAVFASGSGSNYQAIAEAIRAGRLRGADLALLVTDKPEAYVVERAKGFGTPVLALRPQEFSDKRAYEEAILRRLRQEGIDWIVLAGYMRLIGETLLVPYAGKIINLHPSLLPAFPGKDAIGQAYAYGVKVTGVTVHFVDEGLDTGPIIAQRALAVEEGDTLETLARRIQALEHELLPQVIQWLVDGRVTLTGRRVQVKTEGQMRRFRAGVTGAGGGMQAHPDGDAQSGIGERARTES
ncbi:phosphoribosylglycinamide formyltransferase [Bacillaceae bacterium]